MAVMSDEVKRDEEMSDGDESMREAGICRHSRRAY
jgi:hypothetical protein